MAVDLSSTATSNCFFNVRYFKIKTQTNVCQPWKTVGYVNFKTDNTYCKINKGTPNKNTQLHKHQEMRRHNSAHYTSTLYGFILFIYDLYQTKENKMGRTCGTHGREEQ